MTNKNIINETIKEFTDSLSESLECINDFSITANAHVWQGNQKKVTSFVLTSLRNEVRAARLLVEELKGIKFVIIKDSGTCKPVVKEQLYICPVGPICSQHACFHRYPHKHTDACLRPCITTRTSESTFATAPGNNLCIPM